MSNFTRQLKKITEKFTVEIGRKLGRAHFEKVRDFIISEIENHPVSKELRSHTSPSKFIPSLGSHGGSLFGFMGFEQGSDPVTDLIAYLKPRIIRREKFLAVFYKSSVFFPDFTEMSGVDSLKMPWMTGISWPEAIQNGISGLRNFLSFQQGAPPQSRSQEGLQAKSKKGQLIEVRSEDMPPVPYLDEIFAKATKIKI